MATDRAVDAAHRRRRRRRRSARRPKVDFRVIFPPLVNDAEAAEFVADLRGSRRRRRTSTATAAADHGVRGLLLHAGRRPRRLYQHRQRRTARAAARCTTPATISTTPPCRSAPACSRASWRRSCRASPSPDVKRGMLYSYRHTLGGSSSRRPKRPLGRRTSSATSREKTARSRNSMGNSADHRVSARPRGCRRARRRAPSRCHRRRPRAGP